MGNKYVVKSAYTILILFSLFGVVLFGTLMHELSHKKDFKEIASDDYLCFLEFNDGALGSYSFHVNNQTEYERISKYTEIKAYGINVIIFVMYFMCFAIIILHNMDKKYELMEENDNER
jgi:hypothetical protein